MSELLELGTDRRKMVLTVYGRDLTAVVREPDTREMLRVEHKIIRLKGSKRAAFVRNVGLDHLMSIEGIGVRDPQGKLVPLVTDPEKPGYAKDWKQRLVRESLGLKVAALVMSELYAVGGKKTDEEDDEEPGLEDDADLGELDAAPDPERGRKKS